MSPFAGTVQWAADNDGPRPLAPQQTVSSLLSSVPSDPALAQLYLWDPWPVLDADGHVADVHGQEWWVVLTADRGMHPEARHDHARLRLVRRGPRGWQDLGELFPDEVSPGSREWSGTAVFDAATSQLRVFYTATGLRGEVELSFRQRLFEVVGEVRDGQIVAWGGHTELVTAARPYLPADEPHSAPGLCRAFRDPFYFRDPADGSEYLLFAASVPDREQPHAGAIGFAVRQQGDWVLQPPLLDAAGVNRELERPHLLYRDGLYYLFFSTHGQSFRPDLSGRTGLYGFYASDVRGPYTPLNGSGLVLGNPDQAPYAHYAWQVLTDGRVVSFTNYPSCGPGSIPHDAAFAGTIAPFVQLRVQGPATAVETDDEIGVTA